MIQKFIFTNLRVRLISAVVLLAILVATISFLLSPPKSFPNETILEVPKGYGSYQTAKLLKENGLVRSSIMLHFSLVVMRGESKIQAGTYLFGDPISTWKLGKRIVRGEHGFTPRRITLPEGLTSAEMAVILDENLIFFSAEDFVELSKDSEGYLFPDTYLFMPTATSGEVLAKLKSTFEVRLDEVSHEIVAFNKPLSDIITMASIVEEEARDEKDRHIVAGILWNRLEKGMPLQVDATLRYVTGRASAELTVDDLKMDSPYNTYRFKGLPPTPIANPGLESISATVTPIDTPYVYFLTGDDGEMYYGKTLEEHNEHKRKQIKEND